MGAGIGDQGLAPGILHQRGGGHAVMGVAPENDIDAADPGGHLQVHVHAVVRQHHHDIRLLLRPDPLDHLLHPFVLNAEAPVGDEALGIGDGGVGEGLADDRHPGAVEFPHGVGLEGQTAALVEAREVGEFIVEQGLVGDRDVLRHELALEGLEVVDDLRVLVGELPVAGHDVHAQQIAGADHVLAPGPEGGARTLPGVAPVEEQAPPLPRLGAQLLDQGGEVGEAPDLAIALGGGVKVEEGQGMGLASTRGDAEVFQEGLPHQVGGLTQGRTYPQVHVRFPIPDGVELGVGIGDVQQAQVAKGGRLIERRAITSAAGGRPEGAGHQPGHASQGQQAGEFSPGQ